MAKTVGGIKLNFVAGISGLELVQSKFATAEKDIKGGASRIADSFSAASIKTATLELRVDALKRSYERLAESVKAAGVGTQAQYEKLEDTAVKLEIANRRLANSYKATVPKPEAPKPEEGSGFNARFAILGAKDVLEGRMTNAFAEAINEVLRFKGALLGLGVGAIGIVAVGFAVNALREKFIELESAPNKMKAAFRDLNAPIRLTNDELAVTNARLENDIAKLEGRRQNNLKVAVAEVRVEVDKLTDSLEQSLAKLDELFKKHSVSILQKALGTADTKDIQESIFGKEQFAGHGGFTAREEAITDRGRAQIDTETTLEGKQKAKAQLNKDLKDLYGDQLVLLRAQLETSKKLQEERAKTPFTVSGPITGSSSANVPRDQTTRIIALEQTIRQFEQQRAFIGLNAENSTLKGRKESDEITKANSEQGKPFDDRIKALNAQLEGVRDKLSAIGKPQAFQVLMTAAAESTKVIEEVNKALESHHLKLTQDEEGQIRARVAQIKFNEADEQFLERTSAATTEITSRINSLRLLTDAIGRGYEATKRANVETELIKEFGPLYGEQARQAEIAAVRVQRLAAYDADHAHQIAVTTDKLNDQIELERAMAAVQTQGAEAVRLVTLAYRLRQIATDGGTEATRKQIGAEIALYDAQRANLSAESIAKLDEQVKKTQELTAAELQGAEAVRKATLEAKYRELAKNGATPAEVNATRTLDEAEHQRQVTTEALKSGIARKNEMESINQQITQLKVIQATQSSTREVEQSLFDLEQRRLEVMVQQSLSLRTARGGLEAFFTEMKRAGESTAQSIYTALTSAVDRTAGNLSKLLTGQKTEWAAMAKDIGDQLLKAQIKSGIGKLLGPLGDKLGLTKRDGSSAQAALWVQLANQSTITPGIIGVTSPTTAGQSSGGPVSDTWIGKVIDVLGRKIPLIGTKEDWGGGKWTPPTSPSSEGVRLPSGLIDRTQKPGPTGYPSDPVHVVDDSASKGPLSGISGLLGGFGSAGIGGLGDLLGSLGGSAGAGIESVSSSIEFPGFAAGTDATPVGSAYWVGEHGPELEINRTPHQVVPLDKMNGGGGEPTTVYNIDARYSDKGVLPRIQQGMAVAHQQAVATSQAAIAERRKRTPTGRYNT